MCRRIERLNWEVGYSRTEEKPSNFIKAKVPGAVQMDLMRAGELPDYRIGTNYESYAGTEDYFWAYRATLPVGENMFLVSGGVDYRYKVYVENDLIYDYEGMQKPFSLDVTPYFGKEVRILIFPAPKMQGKEGRDQANTCCKGAVSYGWDFHPRLIPLGIWNDCYVEYRPNAYIDEAKISYELSDDFSFVKVYLDYSVKTGGVQFTLGGKTVKSAKNEGRVSLELANPRLWYPNGAGEQFLYEAEIKAVSNGKVYDEKKKKVGFRRVKLVTTPYNWSFCEAPATQAFPPIYLEVNGKKIFAKGTNWVIPTVFYAEIEDETYSKYVKLIKDANMNITRCWGGCTANKEPFFEYCDEAGIMVWQEFPLACNCYPDEPYYLKVLASEAKAMIYRIDEHPCVVMYCGGNELYMGWSGMTEQSKALRLLNAVCLEYAPETPFIMTAPIMGMKHGS